MIGLGMEGGCVAIRVGGILHEAAGIGVISDLRVLGWLLPDKPGKIKYHWQEKNVYKDICS